VILLPGQDVLAGTLEMPDQALFTARADPNEKRACRLIDGGPAMTNHPASLDLVAATFFRPGRG